MILDADMVAGSPWAPEARRLTGGRGSHAASPTRHHQPHVGGGGGLGGGQAFAAGWGGDREAAGGFNALVRQKSTGRLSTGSAVGAVRGPTFASRTGPRSGASARGESSKGVQRTSLDGADLVGGGTILIVISQIELLNS